MYRMLVVVSLLGAATCVAAKPCDSAHGHEFDFWAGDWTVFDVGSPAKSVAHVQVDRILDGCVLHEHYEDTDGLVGQSFSTYDEARERWQQSWVTNRGQPLILEGGRQGDGLRLDGIDHTREGRERLVRVTWKPALGGVRETAVRSVDGGRTWSSWFDLMFRPNDAGADDRAAVAQLDNDYQAAVKRNDASVMERILSDDFVLVIGSGKTFTRIDLLDEARSGHIRYEHQDTSERTVRVWGATAVVTARLHISGTEDGKAFDKSLWYSDTYVRGASGWKYVLGQASLALP